MEVGKWGVPVGARRVMARSAAEDLTCMMMVIMNVRW